MLTYQLFILIEKYGLAYVLGVVSAVVVVVAAFVIWGKKK